MIHLKHDVGGQLYDTLDNQEDEQVGPRAIEPEISLKAKYEKLPSHIIRSQDYWKR